MASHRWLRSLPAILAAFGLAGATSKLWMECGSIGGELQATLFGVAGLLCAGLLAPQVLTWERKNTRLRTRLAASTLLVLGVGFIASIFIGNLVGALDRGAQKRTMGDIRTLATAMESYSIDAKMYPAMSVSTPGDMDALAALLEPTYVKQVPRKDGWGNPLVVRSDGKEYTIISFGCCGEPDLPTVVVAPNGGTTSYQADIIFSDGSFMRFPDGAQQ